MISIDRLGLGTMGHGLLTDRALNGPCQSECEEYEKLCVHRRKDIAQETIK